MIWNLIGAALIVWLGNRFADKLKAGQLAAMYMIWYGCGRSWIEEIRINYSTVILGIRTNTWTAILTALCGIVLFAVLRKYGKTYDELTVKLRSVTDDELERMSQKSTK